MQALTRSCPPPYFPSLPPGELKLDPDEPGPPTPSDFVYTSRSLTLNLGKDTWGTEYPCYGWNSVIEGTVDIRHLKHITRVYVWIDGVATAGIQGSAPLVRRRLLCDHQIVYRRDLTDSSSCLQTVHVPFLFALPSYSINGELPPSFDASCGDTKFHVAYDIRVELFRQGLFQFHETVGTPFLYLPKSKTTSGTVIHTSPGTPCSLKMNYETCTSAPEEAISEHYSVIPYKIIGLMEGVVAPQFSLSAELKLKSPAIYPSSNPINFEITIATPWFSLASRSNLRDRILSRTTVELVKRVTVGLLYSKPQTHETVLGEGQLQTISCMTRESLLNGIPTSVFNLQGLVELPIQRRGGEMTWKIPGLVHVRYALRVCIRSLEVGRDPWTPMIDHLEYIRMTTHSPEDDVPSAPAVALMRATSSH